MSLQCTAPGCIRFFRRTEDVSRHLKAKHPSYWAQARISASAFETPDITSPRAGPSTRPLDDGLPFFGDKCDKDGRPIPLGKAPDPQPVPDNPWSPFEGEVEFRVADLLYREVEMSQGKTDKLFDLWTLSLQKHGDIGPFANHEAMHEAIDSIHLGSAPWRCFQTVVEDNLPENAPEWKTTEYQVWYRDPDTVVTNMLDNPDFADGFDVCPYIELKRSDGTWKWSDVMSGNYCWQQATKIYEDNPSTKGAMLVPIILGSDKTTVSVATGNTEYYPLYLSIGNVQNNIRRAHRNAVIPIGFLAIPKSDRKYDNDPDFRRFKKKLYHASITAILQSLKPAMSTPIVRRCPDGYYRRVMYDLAAYIADYPEQVYLAGTVQDWCPKCTAPRNNLDAAAGPRSREHTEALLEEFAGDGHILWDNYGIDDGVLPFTHNFPRADIHVMLTSDLLHQVIKGTFKDHLVEWVYDYLVITHGDAQGNIIMDDIDRRLAATPAFPGLRRFPHGRRFKQWTGDDSKALMKIYLAAVASYLPDEMMQCLRAFLDFCYLARRQDIDEQMLSSINLALRRFHHYRTIFIQTGVRDDFSLPRQHSLVHYHENIILFGAPGGLCSSITESRHITAVKRPWRRSRRYEALSQMLLVNQRLDKLAALTVDFVDRGLLPTSHRPPTEVDPFDIERDDEGPSDGERLLGKVTLAKTRNRSFPRYLHEIAEVINFGNLEYLTRRFLYEYLNDTLAGDLELDDLPHITSKIDIFNSAVAEFYAPSDVAGIRGMRREHIHCTNSWQGAHRKDCVFVVVDKDKPGLKGMDVVRTMLLFSFKYEGTTYPCALVQWYKRYGRSPDSKTGMWIFRREQAYSVIHLDTILRLAHLLPVFGARPLPHKFDYRYTLDCFSSMYVNQYADHHAHEIIF
ncbi:hypothetical protein K435DRAFT_824275 [Dendrothele bispora CBS 962.96]|uniref:C2H2-type domain-containing protein n=1 Tax=Dendrothele bispora (strain CBS 962.96) TaxID=1314807 RepID=A0A4S8KQ03_DENBC|nr:hypothetical protein K435DRAFT_824275 [Dendrothele bispora CBS 962.96]